MVTGVLRGKGKALRIPRATKLIVGSLIAYDQNAHDVLAIGFVIRPQTYFTKLCHHQLTSSGSSSWRSSARLQDVGKERARKDGRDAEEWYVNIRSSDSTSTWSRAREH